MFCKLAVRNVTRSVRDYLVYFLTLLFGVCVFYVFNSIHAQPVLAVLNTSAHYMVDAILTMINVFSVFVSLVLAGLILYGNSYLMKRRKKELATYLLLGLPQGKVSLLFFLETGLLGLLALVLGLLLGVLAAQGLTLLTVGMFQVDLELFHFTFSLGGVVKTIVYFAVIFGVVMVFSGFSVSRQKLSDLMNADKKNETLKERPLWFSVLIFLSGVVLLLLAYALLFYNGLSIVGPLFFLMLALGSLGTLFFFRGLSGFLLRVCQSNKRLYYKGLNMFVLRQWSSRVHSTYLSTTVICLMLLLAIGITACSVGLNHTIESASSTSSPFDLSIQNYNGDQAEQDFPALLTQAGFDAQTRLSATHSFLAYYCDPALAGEGHSDYNVMVTLSDYNALAALQGAPALTLAGDAPQPGAIPLATTYTTDMTNYLVVPDHLTGQLQVRRQVFVANYYPGDKGAEADFQAALKEIYATTEVDGLNPLTRFEIYMENMGTKILVLFLGLYLGIIFLLASAAVLALQQLSQAADNVTRYGILTRLGASDKLRRRALLTQVALAFFLPLSLAIVHSVVGMTVANSLIAQVGKLDTVASSLTTAAFLVVIYGAYFAATYLSSLRVVKGR